MAIAIIILAIISLVIYFLVSFAKKKQKQAVDMVDQFYKILAIKDEKNTSKLANAGVLFALVSVLFLDVPGANSAIKIMQTYIAFLRKNNFSEKELSCIKWFLFDNSTGNKLSPKGIFYKDFMDKLCEVVSFIIEKCKNDSTSIEAISDSEIQSATIEQSKDTNAALLFIGINKTLKESINNKDFPKNFSDIVISSVK